MVNSNKRAAVVVAADTVFALVNDVIAVPQQQQATAFTCAFLSLQAPRLYADTPKEADSRVIKRISSDQMASLRLHLTTLLLRLVCIAVGNTVDERTAATAVAADARPASF